MIWMLVKILLKVIQENEAIFCCVYLMMCELRLQWVPPVSSEEMFPFASSSSFAGLLSWLECYPVLIGSKFDIREEAVAICLWTA
jgi:hypothetical protein